MNEQVDNAEYEFLWKLLANPAEPNHSYIFNLQSLVADYPQSGALRALLMPNGDKRHLKHAAAYFNPGILHKLATAPESLAKVTDEQIVYTEEAPGAPGDAYLNLPAAEPFVLPVTEPESAHDTIVDDDAVENTQPYNPTDTETPYNTFAETEVADEQQPDADATYTFAEEGHIAEPVSNVYSGEIPAYVEDEPDTYPATEATVASINEEDTIKPEEAPAATQEEAVPAAHEENELGKAYNEHIAESDAQPAEVVSYDDDDVRFFHQAIDDEVYDEIVSIEDIGLEQLAILNKSAKEEPVNAEPAADTKSEENYFVFEPEIDETDGEQIAEPQFMATQLESRPAPVSEIKAQNRIANDYANSDVSRYNDEKMPYTFMWWLDKTRKEHANVYQPYVSKSTAVVKPQNKPPVDELQQQYYQNIVSASSLDDLDRNQPKTPAAAQLRKEDKIIERFIQEEPQIKHPSGIKLNNENKAKRSSEDKEELVTETLARIYTEQMLYHKAILTYKKLMLKYPEKSLYFAGQIEQLENKIN